MDKKDLAQDKKTAAKAVHKHEKAMHPGKKLTKMRKGGPTSEMRMKYGRNVSRAMNQGGK